MPRPCCPTYKRVVENQLLDKVVYEIVSAPPKQKCRKKVRFIQSVAVIRFDSSEPATNVQLTIKETAKKRRATPANRDETHLPSADHSHA